MTHYEEVRVKLTNTQIKKLKSWAKNNAGAILSTNKKKLEYQELPHEWFLGTIQATKIRSASAYSKQLNFKCNK